MGLGFCVCVFDAGHMANLGVWVSVNVKTPKHIAASRAEAVGQIGSLSLCQEL